MNITKDDLGKYVILKNNIKGKITIVDDSTMPIFVRHDPGKSYLVNGTWHYTDGRYSNRNMEEYDIVSFTDEYEIPNKKPSIYNCKHEWEYYLGLSQEFYYCKICDKKKENI
jgi:hypothetical protein